jgi:hypothetical protein
MLMLLLLLMMMDVLNVSFPSALPAAACSG